ncbi:MAG: SPOR domain-containing protein [Bacteroides sp.]
MNELARHIEFLLLENDCVILPDFGGFVAHYTEAAYEAKTQLFMPPMRTIGFNPQLRLNDGLLTQSVMEVQGTNYGDAQKMVTRWVNQLKDKLYEDGSVELTNVGQLRMSIRGTLDFVPYNSRITTSWLYGLGSFEMPRLSEKPQPVASVRQKPAVSPVQRPTRRTRQGAMLPRVKELLPRVSEANLRPLVRLTPAVMQGAAAVVAVLVLFFFFSTPVKNTEVVDGCYAQLMPSELFERIEQHSLAIHEVALPQDEKKPVVVERTTVHHDKVKKPASKPNAVPVSKPVAKPNPVPVTKPAVVKPAAAQPAVVKPTAAQSAVAKPAVAKPAANPSPAAHPAPVTKPQPAATSNDYHIIVASVATEQDARSMVEKLVQQGYNEAKVIVRDGKNRVSLRSLPSQAAAYHAVNQLREGEKFAGAWVLHCKVK